MSILINYSTVLTITIISMLITRFVSCKVIPHLNFSSDFTVLSVDVWDGLFRNHLCKFIHLPVTSPPLPLFRNPQPFALIIGCLSKRSRYFREACRMLRVLTVYSNFYICTYKHIYLDIYIYIHISDLR